MSFAYLDEHVAAPSPEPGNDSNAPNTTDAAHDDAVVVKRDPERPADESVFFAQLANFEDDEDIQRVFPVERIISHRRAEPDEHQFDLLVRWEGEGPESDSWVAEIEALDSARESVYSYWQLFGGRQKYQIVPDEFFVEEVLNVSRGRRRAEVRWVGYPGTHWEDYKNIRKAAPSLLDSYWRRTKRGARRKARVIN